MLDIGKEDLIVLLTNEYPPHSSFSTEFQKTLLPVGKFKLFTTIMPFKSFKFKVIMFIKYNVIEQICISTFLEDTNLDHFIRQV